jgi:ribosomal protein S18 acetylase RimI-like enzyme
MGISTSISRLGAYYTRHGFLATIRRAALGARRALFANRSVLFYCDLATQSASPADLPSFLKVERKKSSAELSADDLQEMTSFWNPKLAYRNIKGRFDLGASLWLIKAQDRLAGYGWTLKGRTIEPRSFPLGQDDVQFLDFHVFPKYRGRAIDWFLIAQILHRLAAEGLARAFGEAAEWNQASLASFKMTPFRRLGMARKLTIFGRTVVWWGKKEAIGQNLEPMTMGISTSFSRFVAYYSRNGFWETIRRAALAVRRALFSNRLIVFYCDIAKQTTAPANIPNSLKVERLRSYGELSPQDLHQIINSWNPKLAHRDIIERFDQGASLWLIKSEDRLAGYSWTLQGRTMAPYYLPLGEDDVHLFDFYAFRKYRGRAIVYFLIVHILQMLAVDGATRVFGEVREWNQASLSFYTMTPFRRLGWARKLTIFGRTIVCWGKKGTNPQYTKKYQSTVDCRPIDC